MRLLLAVFVAWPLVEIALFIAIGQAIGLWPTLLGVVAMAILGGLILRHQGLARLGEVRRSVFGGQLSGRALADAMLVSVAGLLIAVVAKMAAPLFVKRWNSAPIFAILAFTGVALMHWPLPYVFLGLAPVSVAFVWFKR